MTIRHHPSDELLTAFAAGTLDPGAHVAVATHLVACPRCRAWTRAMEQVGAALLEKLPPAPMSAGALAGLEARLNEPPQSAKPAAATATPSATDEVAGLPIFMRRYPAGRWKWIAPGVCLRPIGLPAASDTRVFLLRAGPGTKLLQHSHTGLEMTCVLTGAFTHEGGRFGPGDFDLGDETVDHQPIVDAGEACICLIAMQGGLRLNGIIGRLMQPFIRL
jgi:putative transcriptional regulator